MLPQGVFVAEEARIRQMLIGNLHLFALLFPGNYGELLFYRIQHISCIFSTITPELCCLGRFTFVVAFLLLLTGAALNDQHGEENMYFSYYYCYVVKPGVFAGAAVLSIASVALGLIYYVTLTSTKNINTDSWGGQQVQGGIAMGHPQFPPHSPPHQQQPQPPVFVHEDTYMRRQGA